MSMAFLSPSPIELMMIAVIALIVLGPSRLPEAARSLGKGMREMRNSFQQSGEDDEDEGGEPRDPLPPDDEPQDDGADDASLDQLRNGGEDPAPAAREGIGAAERS
jgi:sec-independent protein translocase protein TatA